MQEIMAFMLEQHLMVLMVLKLVTSTIFGTISLFKESIHVLLLEHLWELKFTVKFIMLIQQLEISHT